MRRSMLQRWLGFNTSVRCKIGRSSSCTSSMICARALSVSALIRWSTCSSPTSLLQGARRSTSVLPVASKYLSTHRHKQPFAHHLFSQEMFIASSKIVRHQYSHETTELPHVRRRSRREELATKERLCGLGSAHSGVHGSHTHASLPIKRSTGANVEEFQPWAREMTEVR